MYDRGNEGTDLIKVGHLLTVFCHTAVEGQTWDTGGKLKVKIDKFLVQLLSFQFGAAGNLSNLCII